MPGAEGPAKPAASFATTIQVEMVTRRMAKWLGMLVAASLASQLLAAEQAPSTRHPSPSPVDDFLLRGIQRLLPSPIDARYP
jgi:hypothetical protein